VLHHRRDQQIDLGLGVFMKQDIGHPANEGDVDIADGVMLRCIWRKLLRSLR
jgi:hypothetical protein